MRLIYAVMVLVLWTVTVVVLWDARQVFQQTRDDHYRQVKQAIRDCQATGSELVKVRLVDGQVAAAWCAEEALL